MINKFRDLSNQILLIKEFSLPEDDRKYIMQSNHKYFDLIIQNFEVFVEFMEKLGFGVKRGEELVITWEL